VTARETAILLVWFLLGIPLVEVTGYFWHRFVEHGGLAGEALRYRHWIHHEREYPAHDLRPDQAYQDARDWSWYVLSALTFCLLGFLVVIGILPFVWMLALSTGGVLYARFVVGVFHDLFHVPKNHWVHRFSWFQRLMFLHDLHHWQRCNYGIVFFWMDRLFGTFCQAKPAAPVNVFPGFVIGG
jgi:hypothetical protein